MNGFLHFFHIRPVCSQRFFDNNVFFGVSRQNGLLCVLKIRRQYADNIQVFLREHFRILIIVTALFKSVLDAFCLRPFPGP
jgi:hypothetical protein